MMKRIIALMLAAVLALPGFAIAEEGWTKIDRDEDRGIKLQKVTETVVEEGISPTTGLPLDEYEDLPDSYLGLAVTGRYQPMMVQIDNTNGGVDGTAFWNLGYADILYETHLHSNGNTRISAIFSDVLPDDVGPVRSARVAHCWIREEWDAGFLFYGGQTKKGSSIKDVFSDYGARSGVVLFSGTDGPTREWKKSDGRGYNVNPDHRAPSNKGVNVASISTMIPEDHVAKMHAFKFTDELPEGDPATEIRINWGLIHYGSNFTYDVDTNTYFRYMRYEDDELKPYVDFYTDEQLSFANVIIQHVETEFNGSSAAPISYIAFNKKGKAAEGNADYFMGGVHLKGYWRREDNRSKKPYQAGRTIYYGPDGNEIELQRGKTLICMLSQPTGSKKSVVVKEVEYR